MCWILAICLYIHTWAGTCAFVCKKRKRLKHCRRKKKIVIKIQKRIVLYHRWNCLQYDGTEKKNDVWTKTNLIESIPSVEIEEIPMHTRFTVFLFSLHFYTNIIETNDTPTQKKTHKQSRIIHADVTKTNNKIRIGSAAFMMSPPSKCAFQNLYIIHRLCVGWCRWTIL